jgi:hypothetical protein
LLVHLFHFRPQLAPRQGIQRAHSTGKFLANQTAFAVQPAEKILRRLLPFVRIAFQAGGHQVAVGIGSRLRARHHVVQAPCRGREPPQTVKTSPALPRVDSPPQYLGLHKVDLLELDSVRQPHTLADRGGIEPRGADFPGHARFHQVSFLAAPDQAQRAEVHQPPHRVSHRLARQTGATGHFTLAKRGELAWVWQFLVQGATAPG